MQSDGQMKAWMDGKMQSIKKEEEATSLRIVCICTALLFPVRMEKCVGRIPIYSGVILRSVHRILVSNDVLSTITWDKEWNSRTNIIFITIYSEKLPWTCPLCPLYQIMDGQAACNIHRVRQVQSSASQRHTLVVCTERYPLVPYPLSAKFCRHVYCIARGIPRW